MLGTGTAGTFLAMSRNTSGRVPSGSSIDMYAALAGISIIGSYIIANYIPFDPVKFSWEPGQFLYLAAYCLVLSVPFFFAGILFATAFQAHSEKSKYIYGSDLLGAGAGSLSVLLLLDIAAPEYAVLSASSLCLIGALIAGRKHVKVLSLIIIAINLSILFINPPFINMKISPYKKLPLFLKYPGAEHLNTWYSSHSRIDTFKSPAVRFAPGLSLKYLDPLPEQTGVAIDGDRIDVITGAGDRSKLRFIEFLPSSAAYQLDKKDRVLVLDPKGGLHVLMAGYYGSGEIHKVESNPMIARLIRGVFREFSGGIFDNNTHTGYGRNRLSGLRAADHETGRYDLIDIPMTGASVTGISGISEDYRYTVEAFKEYLGALKDDGIMSISLYLVTPPRTELRVLSTIITAFEQTGVKDISGRIASIRSWGSMTILVKNSPFTGPEIDSIKNFAGSRNFDLVYYHGIKTEETGRYIKTPADEYTTGFKNLINPETRSPFINNYLFDIKPVNDENPFFHYYLRIENIKAIYEKVGRKWLYFLEEGYLLLFIFLIVLILNCILILLPVTFSAYLKKENQPFKRMEQFKQLKRFKQFYIFSYFAMLGLGFMFVEVPLIQKSILLFENPSHAFAIVLTAILISSGTGSVASSRFQGLSTPWSLILLSLLIFICSLIHPLFINFLSSYGPAAKILLMAVFLMPLGFLMGVPFPMGMKLLGETNNELIPWAWAINSCLSVLAPVVTIMLALVTGFQSIMWLAAVCYFTAFVSLKKMIEIS
jgi:predicted membrane-bound spermidine synthase